jgi:hypothetical protein
MLRRYSCREILISLVLIATLFCGCIFFSLSAYCSQFLEVVPFLEENNLNTESDVREFIAQHLRISSDNIAAVENFLSENNLDCNQRTQFRAAPVEPLTVINAANSVITCFLEISNPSFLGSHNGLLGKLDVCVVDPTLIIDFYFQGRTLVEISTDIVTAAFP